MPRRDQISIDGNTDYGLNVFDTVGVGGTNNPGDVMVIQAMFRYLYELWAKPEYAAFGSLRSGFLLHPDGSINQKTNNAIRSFQRFFYWSVLNVDGRIHPAKYENRNITTGAGKRLMTITLLHQELWMAEETGVDYTISIAKRFPNVAFWIK